MNATTMLDLDSETKHAADMQNIHKNEILSLCSHCQKERLWAYWDAELEYYIYLADEPCVCKDCKAK